MRHTLYLALRDLRALWRQPWFVAVTLEPLVVTFASQDWLMVWPLPNVQVTRQPLIAALPT
jgi:hypothetical protein